MAANLLQFNPPGVFKRVENTDSIEKSVLDYICMKNDLCNTVTVVVANENKSNTLALA